MQLLARLSQSGWTVVESQTRALDWWADEIVVLESEWAPRGYRVHITFLVDPQHDGLRSKGEAVWAVAASVACPANRQGAEAGPVLPIRHHWQENLESFIEAVNQLRLAATPTPGQ